MMLAEALRFVNLIGAGVLAGEEFVIRYGVRGPLANLDQRPHIKLRQDLIRTLRILVPAVFGLTLLSGIAVALIEGSGPGSGFRLAGLLFLVAFISITLAGTVPINQAVLTWDVTAPPEGWRMVIDKWERFDSVRTWAALAAFGLFLAASVWY